MGSLPMRTKLHAKIMLSLAVIAGAMLVAVWWAQVLAIGPGFRELEMRQAQANLERAREALADEIRQVDDFLSDWSGWDDTYQFIADGNQEFRKSNLDTDVFRPNSFDFLCMVRADGSVAFSDGLHEGTRVRLPELPTELWSLPHDLLPTGPLDASVSGVLLAAEGPLLLASRPITDSARTAEPRGWILMGRFLTGKRRQAIGQRLRLAVDFAPTDALHQQEDYDALQRLLAGASADFQVVDESLLRLRSFLPAIHGPGGLLLSVGMPRLVMAQGAATMQFSLWSTAACILALFGALHALMHKIVVRPVGKLTEHALAISASGDLTRRCELRRSDELGQLAGEFDAMVARLGALQASMVEHAWHGGRAEVAAAVLHDVGNALQGLRASVGVLRDLSTDGSAGTVADLGRLAELFGQQAEDMSGWLAMDARAAELPRFLEALHHHAAASQQAAGGELAVMLRGLDHIQALIDQHQDAAVTQPGVQTEIRCADLVAEAQRLAGLDASLAMVVHGESELHLHVDVDVLLAVLINLLRNAQQAMQALPWADQCIDLSIARCRESGAVRITVQDRGVGFVPGTLVAPFKRGFTTKASGHGIGLHACARKLAALGGSLLADSDGPDLGARFTIVLPAACVAEVCLS